MKKITILISVIAVLALFTQSFAEPAPGFKKAVGSHHEGGMWGQGMKGMQRMKWWKNPENIEKIGLTDDQLEKFNKLESDSQKTIIKLGADLAIKRIELREAMEKPDFDESKIKKLIDEIVKLQCEITKITMQAMLKGLKILTKEQRKKLIKLRRSGLHRKKGKTKKQFKEKR